ncbi:MAG: HyaD/HybD family hydrogenase maturation endopeptidase [Deltaproteobacteria bacterium]|nr:HyaD/HybD family hydrogenase maturation endopeptidase [Candidatus Zymogenaceae bacterium]
MTEKCDITVLGLGNILLGDEGFGVHFVRWFEGRHRFPDSVRIVDGGVLGYLLLDTVTDTQNLIIVDVIKTDDTPGSVYRFDRKQFEDHLPPPTSAHEIEFLDVLIKAELIGRLPHTSFILVVPERIDDMIIEMTPRMTERFVDVERLLLEELSALGCRPLGEAARA